MRKLVLLLVIVACLLLPLQVVFAVSVSGNAVTPAPLPMQMQVPANGIVIVAPVGLTEGRTAAIEIYCADDVVLDTVILTYRALMPEICTVEEDGVVTAVQEGIGQVEIISNQSLYSFVDEGQTVLGDPANRLVIDIAVDDVQIYQQVIVHGYNAPLYDKPSMTSEHYAIVRHGEILEYTGSARINGGFLEVVYHGKPAYVHMSAISFSVERQEASIKSPLQMTVTIKSGFLNVRNTPNGTTVGKLKNGSTITVIDNSDLSWYQLDTGLFVAAAYVTYMIP